MITGFHHFEITTADADRQAAFYGEHFGMVLVSDREIAPGGFTEKVTGVPGARVRIVHLQGWGLNFELLEYREPGGDTRAREPNHAGSAHLCFVTTTSRPIAPVSRRRVSGFDRPARSRSSAAPTTAARRCISRIRTATPSSSCSSHARGREARTNVETGSPAELRS